MRKKDELARPDTCMAHAHPEEMVFVLLGRDPAAPVAIRTWAQERVRLEKNRGDDPQVLEAYDCARTMEAEGRRWADAPPPVVADQDYRREVARGNVVNDMNDPIDALVIADMAERDRLGRARYGVPLTTGNGRDHLVDAYQEQSDFAVYLRAWLEEHMPEDGESSKIRAARFEIRRVYREQLTGLWNLRRLISELAEIGGAE